MAHVDIRGREGMYNHKKNAILKLTVLTPVTKIKQLKMDFVCQMVLIHYLEVLRPDQCFL